MNKGKVVKTISNQYFVYSDGKIYECKARGKFRNEKISPLVGDYCLFDKEKLYIMEILPRKNSLHRPLISNVDVALILTSVKKPNFSSLLLDKQLVLVQSQNIKPIIIISKMDLLTKKEKKDIIKIIKMYKKVGFTVLKNTNLFQIKRALRNKTVVLTGQTGAGKSTLLNKIGKLNIETKPISEALGRGVHTTRHTESYKVGKALISDTPGFSSLNLNINKDDLKNYYPEFQGIKCHFKGCNHIKETKCGVKEKLNQNEIYKSRYDNYVKLWEEL